MKSNKKLLILILSLALIVGLVFTFTSCSKELKDDTDTSLNDDLSNENNLNDNKEDLPKEDDKNDSENKEEDSNDEESSGKDNTPTDDNLASDNDLDNNGGIDSDKSNQEDSSSDNIIKEDDNISIENMKINEYGIYAINNYFFKSIYPLDEKSVIKAANYMNNLQETYFTEKNKVFYAIIPDKSYYDESLTYDKLDYDKMIEMLNENIKNMEYIKLKDLLSLDDYHKTDNHWKQENIVDVANKIGEKLNFKIDSDNFKIESYSDFKGMYSKYLGDTKFKEELQYLLNDHILNATVDNYQNKEFTSVYDIECLKTDISYDVFLSGASPFTTITNTAANSDKELVVFRDSFASSLAPLLVSEYSKITLIDTRYMMSFLIKDFIEFNNQDVLFLYSSALINRSSILK